MNHQQDIDGVAELLVKHLTPALAASMTGNIERDAPLRWASGSASPSSAEIARLRAASDAWEIVCDGGLAAAQRFFMSANPMLGGRSPIEAIREEELDAVFAAARAWVDDAYTG